MSAQPDWRRQLMDVRNRDTCLTLGQVVAVRRRLYRTQSPAQASTFVGVVMECRLGTGVMSYIQAGLESC
jgi:hypothetical protein